MRALPGFLGLIAALALIVTTTRAAPAPPPAGLAFDYDVPVAISDGVVLRADVFRPDDGGASPHAVIVSMAPYGKDFHFRDYFPIGWKDMEARHPGELCAHSSCRYAVYETPDPEPWVAAGYVVIRIDARGSGRSPGVADHLSTRQAMDYAEAVEWAARQPWSNGKVGAIGISYYSWMSWLLAGLNPPHLAGVINWEGSSDIYREIAYHGGIRSSNPVGVNSYANQHGQAKARATSFATGLDSGPDGPTGPQMLSERQLQLNRVDTVAAFREHPLDDAYYRARSANLANVKVPILMAGNWTGLGLHGRSAPESYNKVGTAAADKWLEMHSGAHWEEFYLDRAFQMQKRFFDHYLRGEDNGWTTTPHVSLSIRRPDSEAKRGEADYPLARTRFTDFYLDVASRALGPVASSQPAEATYQPLSGSGVQFVSAPFKDEVEILGPVSLHLWLASASTDADLFVRLQIFDLQGREVTFTGANDPHAPVSQGWLRASQRKSDPALSQPGRPWHTHDEVQKLAPGQAYPVDVEIWPTSMVFPKGYRLGLLIDGKDPPKPDTPIPQITHNDPDDRPPGEFGAAVTLFTGGDRAAYLTLPVIPRSSAATIALTRR